MNWLVSMVVLVALLVGVLPAGAQTANIQITSVSGARRDPVALTIPWVEAGNLTWRDAPPPIVIEGVDPGARAWAAVSTQGLLMRIVVDDAMHVNKQVDAAIWDGDAIQLGIDMLGRGVGGLARDSAFTGPNVASITFALTPDGPKAWAHHHGRPGGEGAMPQLTPVVTRDEATHTTTYDLVLPWDEFQASPGLSPVMGLAIQVNDTDEAPEQKRIYFGDGAGGAVRPGLFRVVGLGDPPGEVISTGTVRKDLYRVTDRGEMVVAVASRRDLTIRAALGGSELSMTLPGAERGPGFARYGILALPRALTIEPLPMSVQIMDANAGEVMGDESALLERPGRVVDELHARLEAMADQASHPLLARHFRAVDALVQTDWHRSLTVADDTPHLAAQTVQYAARIRQSLDAPDAADFEAYRAGRRGLVLSFISPTDRTLQHYSLSLPRHWDPARSYPLIVHLHGAGNPHPLDNIANSFPSPTPATAPTTQEAQLPPIEEPFFVLWPWGRGNYGYHGVGEADVFEAMSDMTRVFAVEADRRYLMGFSMGGGGTWALGITRPDAWAAITVMAGGPWWAPTQIGLGRNLRGTPVMIWHGDQDGAVPVTDAYDMQKELEENGVKPVMTIVPGVGHLQTGEATSLVYRWLLQHKRRRPAELAYKAADAEHRQCWGVRMRYNAALSPFPSFACRIEAQDVHLTSEGTDGLDVDLGPEGLGMTGEVRVFWNGVESYRGPATRARLGEGAGW
jgi:predicted esterase